MTVTVITRKEAIKQGLLKYYTGKPCKHGHYSERYTLGSECQACIKSIVYAGREEIKAIRVQMQSNDGGV